MAVREHKAMSTEAFDRFAERPENADKLLEFIGGEVFEAPSNPYASEIAGVIFGELYIFLKGKNLGHLTGEAGGCMVGGERFAPDVAYISSARQLELVRRGYNPNPPDLAVEVISDPASATEQNMLRLKLSAYLAAGVVVWVVNAEERAVEVHQPGRAPHLLTTDGTLEGGAVLPGFSLAVKEIFPAQA